MEWGVRGKDGRDGLANAGRPPLILREPQHERPNAGEGVRCVSGQVLDSRLRRISDLAGHRNGGLREGVGGGGRPSRPRRDKLSHAIGALTACPPALFYWYIVTKWGGRGKARKGVRGQVLYPSWGLGMIRLWRTGSPRGVGRDGLEGRGSPPLDPSIRLGGLSACSG